MIIQHFERLYLERPLTFPKIGKIEKTILTLSAQRPCLRDGLVHSLYNHWAFLRLELLLMLSQHATGLGAGRPMDEHVTNAQVLQSLLNVIKPNL